MPTWHGRILPGARRESYFGYADVDRQVSETDAVTLVLDHSLGESLSLRSQTRWQQTDQFLVVDPPQGSFCLADGTSPSNAGLADTCPAPAGQAPLLPGEYQPSGPRGTTRDTRNRIFISQADLAAHFSTGPVQHTLVAGMAISSETYYRRSGNSLRQPDGATPNPPLPRTTIANPSAVPYTGPVNFIVSQTLDGEVDNRALYVFDNIRFLPRWSFNGGVRIERNEADFEQVNLPPPASSELPEPPVPLSNEATLLSFRAGLVFKPGPLSSIYLAWGNSGTPSVSTVNGSCTAASCNVDPEKAESIELGAKWDALGGRLSLTAAVARNERTNYRVDDPGNPDNPSGQQVLDGRARVDSAVLGAAGRLLPGWSIFASYTFLDSEVLQGASDSLSGAGQDHTRGDPLTNTPRHAASLWTTWDVARGLQLGYGLTWQGKVYIQQHSAANPDGPLPTVGGYLVHRAMASYEVNGNLRLQLNANNLLDKQYLTRLRTQRLAWATPGEARSVVLSAHLSF